MMPANDLESESRRQLSIREIWRSRNISELHAIRISSEQSRELQGGEKNVSGANKRRVRVYFADKKRERERERERGERGVSEWENRPSEQLKRARKRHYANIDSRKWRVLYRRSKKLRNIRIDSIWKRGPLSNFFSKSVPTITDK